MDDSKRTRKAKKKGGRILRILLLLVIVILGFQVYQLGIFNELGNFINEFTGGKIETVIQSGKNVWVNWDTREKKESSQEAEEEYDDTEVHLECVYLSQKELGYPTGCEAVTAVMALQTAGVEISVEEFFEVLPQEELYEKDGKTYGPDPRQVFVGSPTSESGYGCFAPVIQKTVEDILVGNREGITVQDLTGTSLEELKNQLDQGNPVILWASRGMGAITYQDSWQVEGRSMPYFWPRGEHCLLLIGYRGDYLFFNDPIDGENVAYQMDQVEDPYEELGRQSLVISTT